MRLSSGMAEWPDQEVVADIVVDLGKAERFQHQEADDQRAVEHQRDMRAQIAFWSEFFSKLLELLFSGMI